MDIYVNVLAKACTFFIIIFVCSTCAPKVNTNIERGSSYKFKLGYPEIRFSALGLIDDNGKGYVDISVDIVKGSLIYKKTKEKFRSEVLIKISLLDPEGQDIIKSVSSKQFIKENTNLTQQSDQNLYNLNKQIKVKPGSYKIRLSINDLFSQKESVLTDRVDVPDPSEGTVSLTSIKMFTNDKNKGWSSVTGYNIKSEVDSIKFVVQAINNKPSEIINVQTELLRFEADTSIAEPMHVNYVSFKKQEGINYDEKKVIQSTTRSLSDVETVSFEFKFGSIEKGNYRFKIIENDTDIFKGRDFGIKSANYPTLKTPREFARPLAYIMSEDEYKNMMTIQDSDSLKKAIDRFWLKNIGSVSKAKKVIRLYYTRVEEANKQFSNYKEGWKTDRGMIYVLFGPPWFKKTDLRSDNIQWSYSNDHYESPLNFLFKLARDKTKFYHFENYYLKRKNSYFNLQYQQIELWESGNILTTRIGI
jgi:GWxTD domain-containing protein